MWKAIVIIAVVSQGPGHCLEDPPWNRATRLWSVSAEPGLVADHSKVGISSLFRRVSDRSMDNGVGLSGGVDSPFIDSTCLRKYEER
jgi:hypothetical protein